MRAQTDLNGGWGKFYLTFAFPQSLLCDPLGGEDHLAEPGLHFRGFRGSLPDNFKAS